MSALTDGDGGAGSFLGRRVPPCFVMRVVTVPVGSAVAYVEEEWRGAIVVVERGEVELEAVDGERHRFGPGDLIWLEGVRLRVLRNAGEQPLRLKAISRPSGQRGP
jgi:glyoxylate utilization-related uncharacterized protein